MKWNSSSVFLHVHILQSRWDLSVLLYLPCSMWSWWQDTYCVIVTSSWGRRWRR